MQKDNNILSVSIVLYCNPLKEIKETIDCVLKSDILSIIYLIDNSPSDVLKSLELIDKKRIKYFFQNANLGFGKAHNIALQFSLKNEFSYHLILNPDIKFEKTVLKKLIQKLKLDDSIGLIMPKIINVNGSNQLLPKLLPTPFNLLVRTIKPLRFFFKELNEEYVLKDFENTEISTPLISGCFSIYSIKAYKEIGGYDDRFFMYYEDFDLSRRVHTKYKTLYYPFVEVIHGYERGAVKSFRLFKVFVTSVVKYFNKYGWILDSNRKKINKKVLDLLLKN